MSAKEIKERFPFVVEAADIQPLQRIKIQAAMQSQIDNAISSTINLPESATVEDIEKIYMQAYKLGLKGVTVFRDNCKRASILNFTNDKMKEMLIARQSEYDVAGYIQDIETMETNLSQVVQQLISFKEKYDKFNKRYDDFKDEYGNNMDDDEQLSGSLLRDSEELQSELDLLKNTLSAREYAKLVDELIEKRQKLSQIKNEISNSSPQVSPSNYTL